MNRELGFETHFAGQLAGYGLTTINVLYRLPEETILRTFIWQFNDLAPAFPRLNSFLDFWKAEVNGVIHSVDVAHRQLCSASEIRHARFHGHVN